MQCIAPSQKIIAPKKNGYNRAYINLLLKWTL